MGNDDQILQEQDRDYKRTEVEIGILFDKIEAISSPRSEIVREYVAEIKSLIKILGVNL